MHRRVRRPTYGVSLPWDIQRQTTLAQILKHRLALSNPPVCAVSALAADELS